MSSCWSPSILGWILFGAGLDLSTFGGAALIVAGGLWLWRSQKAPEVSRDAGLIFMRRKRQGSTLRPYQDINPIPSSLISFPSGEKVSR